MCMALCGAFQIGFAQIPPVSVELPVTDAFDYTAGDLQTQAPIWGTNGTASVIQVKTGSLTYPNFSTSGNKIELYGSTVQADRYVRNFKQNKDRTDFYASFLFKVTTLPDASAPATGDYFMCFGNVNNASNFSLVYLRKSVNVGFFNLGLLKRGEATNDVSKIVWSNDDLSPNVTYHLVMGSALGTTSNTDDVANLWVNPSDLVAKPAPTLTTIDGADLNNYYAMVWVILESRGLNSGLVMEVDELHVSENWTDLVTLPVNFDKFSAEAQTNRTKLSWNTLSEQNNNHFEVERSFDGTNFTFLAKVGGKGTTNTASAYTIYDENPLNGTNYYRLIQVDNNGKRTELAIKSVSFKLDNAVSVTVYPNPIGSEINLLLNNYTGSFKAVLSALDRRVVHQQAMEAVNGQSVYQVFLASKPTTGTYILQVTGGNGLAESVKVIVP